MTTKVMVIHAQPGYDKNVKVKTFQKGLPDQPHTLIKEQTIEAGKYLGVNHELYVYDGQYLVIEEA